MVASNLGLAKRIAVMLQKPSPGAAAPAAGAILTLSANCYGSSTASDDITQPTGFDPRAAALFEAIVEAAFLVASADGVVDDAEQELFKQTVTLACGGAVQERQLSALMSDLAEQLQEDGMSKRLQMVARLVQGEEQSQEVLRVAALLAAVSGGVSDVEEATLRRLAELLDLKSDVLDAAVQEAASAVGAA